jgi:Zn-dependent M28 family amino/carboxypeptidase
MAEKIHHLWLMKLHLILFLVVTGAVLQSQVGSEVSVAEIDKTLHAIDADRTAASDGERGAAEYLDRTLAAYGIAHTRYDARLYLSWPGRASLAVDGLPVMNAKTAAFAAATPVDGVSGALIVNPTLTRRVDQTLAFGPEVRNRIPVVRDVSDTEALVLAGQRAGARAIVQIDATDTLHEDIVTTTWGTPTTASAETLPAIPFVTITKSDGERLLGAAVQGVTARVTADVTRGWRSEPIVIAEVPGRSPDFVLVATHLDAWYRGMTDTGGSDASILEMARVLHTRRGELARGVRFAWWTGHSFGRYAGSTWYVDRFWTDLDRHCVAYTNLDGPGRRGSRVDAISASGWPGLADYARESAVRISGKTPAGGRGGGSRVFRPGRDSDSSFQGLGIPFFSIGVPGPTQASGDIDAAGRVAYWHAPDDTYAKLDLHALELDTKYRVAQLYELATLPVLPHRIEPIAASYSAALKELSSAAGSVFDLSSTVKLAAALDEAASRFDRSPHTDAAAFNTTVVRLTHELNATLYTRAGRFDQDPAAALPVLPLLARVKDLATLSKDSDEYGFLETELIRGQNAVEATLRHAVDEIASYEGHR